MLKAVEMDETPSSSRLLLESYKFKDCRFLSLHKAKESEAAPSLVILASTHCSYKDLRLTSYPNDDEIEATSFRLKVWFSILR